MASEAIVELNDSSFDTEVINSEKPVLVDFWAPWCGPCKALGPVIEEISNDFVDRVKVGKVNVDENPEISMKFGIRSIPTLIVFKNGEVQDQIIGAVPKSEIEKALEKVV
jgi:thioredoxin 1